MVNTGIIIWESQLINSETSFELPQTDSHLILFYIQLSSSSQDGVCFILAEWETKIFLKK